MITGSVDMDGHATIRLTIRGPGAQEHEIEAIIDTGFNGFLTLPKSLVQTLQLPQPGRGRAVLADGSEGIFNIHACTVVWDGVLRQVETDTADCDPLVGMALLERHELRIQVTHGGRVAIEPL